MRPGGAVIVDDLGNHGARGGRHAVDGLLVAGDEKNAAEAEDYGVAGVDAACLWLLSGGPREERRHGLALGSGNEHQELAVLGLADLAGMMMRPGGTSR